MLLQDIYQRRSTRFWKSSSCKFKFNRTRWFCKRILRKGKDTLFHKDNSCLRNAQRTNVIISFLLDASASVHFHMWLCFLLDNASRKLTTNRKLLYCTFLIPAQIFILNFNSNIQRRVSGFLNNLLEFQSSSILIIYNLRIQYQLIKGFWHRDEDVLYINLH